MNGKVFAATIIGAAAIAAWPASALANPDGVDPLTGAIQESSEHVLEHAAADSIAGGLGFEGVASPVPLTGLGGVIALTLVLKDDCGGCADTGGAAQSSPEDPPTTDDWYDQLRDGRTPGVSDASVGKGSKSSADSQASTSANETGGRPDDAVPPPRQSSPSRTSKKDTHAYVEEIPQDEIVVDTAAGIMWIWNPNTGKWDPFPIPDPGTGGGSGGGGGKDSGPTGGDRGDYSGDSSDDNTAQDGDNGDSSASGSGNGSQGDNSSSSGDSSSSQDDSSSSSSSSDSGSSSSSSGDSGGSTSDSNGSSTDDGSQCSGSCGSGGGDEMGNPDAPGGDGPGGDETSAPWTGKLTTPVDAESALESLDSGPQVDENIVTAPLGKGADAEALDQQQPVTQDPGGEGIALNLAGVQAHGSSVGTSATEGWGDKPLTMAQSVAAPRMNVGSVSLRGALTR